MKQDDIRLIPISNGSVLDHLPAGTALKIIEILGLEKSKQAVTVAINTESRKMGKKDLAFIEGKELSKEEIDKVGLIAQGATLNIIKNSKVKRKETIKMPNYADGLIKCLNPKCITETEQLPSKFKIRKKPLRAKCVYCEKEMNEQDIFNAMK